MRRRPAESKAVTLFPFLAVMICTMGALILVLLSLSGKMRVTAEAVRDESLATAVQMAPALPPIIIQHRTDPQSQAEKERRLKQWQEALRDRREELDLIQQLLAEKRAALDRSVTAVAAADNQLLDIDQVIASALADSEKLTRENQTLHSRHAAFQEQVLKAKNNLEDLRKRQAAAPSKFALVPFEGSSGTVRRPIYLECTANSIRFLPEGVTLRESDFEGFATNFNPLLAGAQTLVEHWTRKHEENPDDNPKPYVLLLVRPSGAMTYYAAKLMLSKLRAPYGYELIEESFPLSEPEPDPTAKALLEAAISTLLDAQPTLLAKRGSATPVPLGSARRLPGNTGGSGSPLVGSVRNGVPRGLDLDTEPPLGPVPDTESPEETGLIPGAPTVGNGSRRGTPGRRPASIGGDRDFDPSAERPPGPAPEAGVSSAPSPIQGAPLPSGSQRGAPGRRPASLGGDRDVDPAETGELAEGSLEAPQAPGKPGPSASGTPAAKPRGPDGLSSTPGEPRKLPHLDRSGTTGPAQLPTEETGESLPKTQSPFRTGHPGSESQRGASDGSAGGETGPAQGRGSRSSSTSRPGPRGESGGGGIRWGNTTGSTIGLEQDIKVHIYHDRIVIGEDGPALGIALGASKQQLVEGFNRRIEDVVAEWGDPPRRFHWLPRIRFVVHPGGNQHYERLRDAVRQWKLSSTVDFSIDAGQPPLQAKPNPTRKK